MTQDVYETDFLTELTLLRNDPELIDKVRPQAEIGNPHAQYAMGLIYAEGRGVKVNKRLAYIWLSRAIAQGDLDASLLRDMLLNDMSAQEVEQAEREV